MTLKTPIYDRHGAAEGQMVDFAGYWLPVSYKTGIIREHMAVREAAGLFDISHMGEIFVEGPCAAEWLDGIFTNAVLSMKPGGARYQILLNDAGGVIDDLIAYRLTEEKFLLVVNAVNIHRDFARLKQFARPDVSVTDASDRMAGFALQGPRAEEILSRALSAGSMPVKRYTFVEDARAADRPVMIARTGYTGEDGFELYLSSADAVAVWDRLIEVGRDAGLIPCGLGARDSLRLEASLPLYGHELTDEITPLEAGLQWAVKPEGRDFPGREAMLDRGARRVRAGLQVTGRGIAREGHSVHFGDRVIGVITSGTHLPYLNGAYAMALLDVDTTAAHTPVEVDIRGRRVAAEIVEMPFYRREKK